MEAAPIVAHVYDVVRSSKNQRISGSQLSALIRYKFSDFSPYRFQCNNLRAFIKQYAPLLAEGGRSGMDFEYMLAESSTGIHCQDGSVPADNPTNPSTPENRPPGIVRIRQRDEKFETSAVWKTFARPTSPYTLYAHSETGELMALPPRTSTPNDVWKYIPPCSPEAHKIIAKEFIESLSNEEYKKALSSRFEQPRWWLSFYEFIQQVGLAKQWNSFRTPRILQELKDVMASMHIPTAYVPRRPILPQIEGSTKQSVTATVASSSFSRQEKLRDLAAKLIQKMTPDDLRDLNVRLGDVFDTLGL